VEKHYSNSQCFVRKATVFSPHDLALLVIVILDQLNIKKIISTKTVLEKTITKKPCGGNIVAIHNVFFLITKLNYNQLNIKIIKLTKIILKKMITKKKHKKRKKKPCGETL